jgi:hypothetical protein
MDITANQLKTMKSKELRKIIREAIQEVLAENTAMIATKTGTKSISFKDPKELEPLRKDSNVTSIETTAGQKLKEQDIEEMARIAKGFRLADPNIDTSQFTKSISRVPLSDIINYFRENPGAEKGQLQAHFGFVRPQIANAIVNGLLDAGVLVKLSASGEVEATPEPGEEVPTQATDVEDLFVGGSDPLSMYFDKEPNADGSEDFSDEVEPSTGEVEPAEPASTGGMSDEDYAAWDKYDTLKSRLNGVKSDLNRMKRSKGRGGVAGDIGDKPTDQEQRLRDLKKSLEDRINTLVASSDYLKKKVAKDTNKAAATEPSIEPEEDDTIDEAYDAEYTKRRLQFYAGIIK